MNRIHSTAFVGPGVILGDEVRIGPHAVVLGPAVIGNRVWIGPGVQLGGPPEIATLPQRSAWDGDLGYEGVTIEDDVVIRENAVIHQGSHRPTTVGARTWILNSAYLAHDVVIGEDAVVSAGVRIGGHVEVGANANIGMSATVHQRRIIGPGAMVGMGTPVTRDVPPFAKAYGSPGRVRGVNEYVLRKLNASPAEIALWADVLQAPAADDFPGSGWQASASAVAWWLAHPRREPMMSAIGRES